MVAPQEQLPRLQRRVVTLLIDNYDSYTFNIYQMLAQVNGVAPLVVRNDDFGGDFATAWSAFQRHATELCAKDERGIGLALNVVISPGPGHPGVVADFGMCADAIRNAQVPVLGICLGHQGLAQVYGGRVVSAPEVMHGRTSRVHFCNAVAGAEDGKSPATLFSHIPDGFEVVRYHSLVADEASLPADLRVTARTDDGVVMALQHANKLQFGVQFHPEAVCSTFGYQLFQNFRDITLQQPPTQCRLQHSNLQPHVLERPAVNECNRVVSPQAKTGEPDYSVQVRVASSGLASLDFAQHVFADRYADSRRSFWLDSSNFDGSGVPSLADGGGSSAQQPLSSRFSLMGDGSGPLSYSVEYCILENLLRVYEDDGETELFEDDTDILAHLRSKMAAFRAHEVEFVDGDREQPPPLSAADIPFSFRGGFVGYFGYEVLGSGLRQGGETASDANRAAIQKRLDEGDHVPDASFLFADRTLVFDHLESKVYSVSVSMRRGEDSGVCGLEEAIEWHRDVATQLQRLTHEFINARVPLAAAAAGARSASDPLRSHWQKQAQQEAVVFYPSRSRRQYGRNIREIQRLIHDGETYEVCLTNQLEATHSITNPLGFYQLLRKRNPAPYAGFYHRFLRVGADGWMESKPIKGTRRRGLTPSEDAAIAAELASCTKDRAENMMIADLVRNDFGVVAQIGSVHVPTLMAVETYATVHQLVTTVRGQRRADADIVDILNATFPGGSMTGAPKKRTMQIIRQLEQGPRGVYSGALGFLSLDGSCDLNIVIRTAVVTPKRVRLGSGGAIIALSDTDEEYEEMLLKTRALVQAL
ncbi:hypothetical protein PybrP1_012594, partial [[Pythium] brassicae (nom. inval.)]